jgi:putative ABC transport system permease protein
METMGQDFRYAFRTLGKTPGFTAIAALTLALGIGASTAVFSAVNAVLLRPLPYKDAVRLVVLNETDPRVGDVSVSYPDFLDWRAQSRAFSEMAAAYNLGANLSGVETPERVEGYGVSANFLSLLGVRPMLGRDFSPQEEKKGTAPVLLLSYNLWQSHFGADPGALGKTVTLDGRDFVILGVLPPGLRFLDQTDFIGPMGPWVDDDLMDRGNHGDLAVVARLAPGSSIEQARVEMTGIQTRLAAQYSGEHDNEKQSVDVRLLRDVMISGARAELLVLFAAVSFLLLIASVNVANMYLVRATARGREIAVRVALGASRSRIIRQILSECLLISVAGGGAGVLFGLASLRVLSRWMPLGMFEQTALAMDRAVLAFAASLIVGVTFIFGLAPALGASRSDVNQTLQQGGRGSSGGVAHRRLRAGFAVAEMALAMVLLVAAGLLFESLRRLLAVDPGFRTEQVLTMEVDLGSARYAQEKAVVNFWQRALEQVRAVPGVQTAAVGTVVPLTDNHNRTDILFEGLPVPERGQYPHPDYHLVSPGYLAALGIPLLRGRDFTESDNPNSMLVGLINNRVAQRYFAGQDPIGKRFKWGHAAATEKTKWVTIVGVVGDTKLYGLENPSRLEIYAPYQQQPDPHMNLIVRSAVDPGSLVPAIRAAVAAVDKDQPVFDISTMEQMEADATAGRRSTLMLLGLFSALALLLAAIGVYGVLASSTMRRTHEIGIRMALGAQQGDVLRLVLGECGRLTLVAVAIGALAAAGFTRLMSSLLYGVSASDPLIFAVVAVAVAAVALAACWIPARRAVRVDPISALRYE